MIYLDTETCGLVGPIVLIQYMESTESCVHFHHVWKEPISKTLSLIERFCNDTVVGFNLVFDWFHFNKLYNICRNISDKSKPPSFEETYRQCLLQPIRYCLKPKAAIDLYLKAKKSEWQSLMHHDDTRIRRVPIEVAQDIVNRLSNKLSFPSIFNAHWLIEPDEYEPTFADIILRFKPTSALKALSQEIFKCGVYNYPVPKEYYPKENAYDPYDKVSNWPSVIWRHVDFWYNDKVAKSYAEQDIILLERLYHYFNDPEVDLDSILACAVGASRWHGFAIDSGKIAELLQKYTKDINKITVNINSSNEVKKYLKTFATSLEKVLINNTSKETLQTLVKFKTDVSVKAQEIIDARKADKAIDTINKLYSCGRFCPELRVIGTRSGRMSGGSEFGLSSSINPQGIQRDKDFRSIFKLADNSMILSAGDFKSFEVTIADAVYKDENLRRDLQSGKSFHGLFGEEFYDLSYDEILSSKGLGKDYYTPSKNAAFGFFYGAMPAKLAATTGVSEERARVAYQNFIGRYPRVGSIRESIYNSFCSMQQPGGLGTSIYWNEPAPYIASLLGFRRYFTLENNIVRALFELAQNLPRITTTKYVKRRDRVQTVSGACQSALYAAAFQLQASNMRAAANHVIQSTGAEITKQLQGALWNLQPSGISEWKVSLLNAHDEVLCVHDERLPIKSIVEGVIEKFKPLIPLIEIDWHTNVKSWNYKE